MSTTDRPLHPDGADHVFTHPIAGCVHRLADDYQQMYVQDYGKGTDPKDRTIDQGQQFQRRLALGDWLVDTQPEDIKRMIHQGYIDHIFPLNFEGDDAETKALVERIDMANSVMEAGGGCTICDVQPDPETKQIDHRVGCEWISWLLHSVMKEAADGEPSLRTVVRKAYDQIERMS